MKAVRECKRETPSKIGPQVHVAQLQGDLCAAHTILSAADGFVRMLDLLDKESRRRDDDCYAAALLGMLRDARNAIDSAATEADELDSIIPAEPEAANG